jgi:hypothetical protein
MIGLVGTMSINMVYITVPLYGGGGILYRRGKCGVMYKVEDISRLDNTQTENSERK